MLTRQFHSDAPLRCAPVNCGVRHLNGGTMNSYQDLFEVINKLLNVETEAFHRSQNISDWVQEIRDQISKNRELLEKSDEISKLSILKIFFRDIIQKGVPGETCLKVERLLNNKINRFTDLNIENYKFVMKYSGYRFPSEFYIWDEMVKIIENKYGWNWKNYVADAENNYINNFKDDNFLNIKGVGVNVRNLALSNFSPHFPKIDKHIGEVFNRLEIGKLILGKKLPISWHKTEKLQPLFVEIAKRSKGNFSETDLDRIFWHFGREICANTPKCRSCPVAKYCSYKYA